MFDLSFRVFRELVEATQTELICLVLNAEDLLFFAMRAKRRSVEFREEVNMSLTSKGHIVKRVQSQNNIIER